MPRLVADVYSGAQVPWSALGYARIPGALNGNRCQRLLARLTPLPRPGMNALTYKTKRGRQNCPCAFLFPSFEKGVPRSLAANQNASWVKWRSRISSETTLNSIFCSSPSYPAVESLARHNLGTFLILEHPPQSQIHKKLEPHIPRQRAVKRQPPFI
jgi:hypothetical protein